MSTDPNDDTSRSGPTPASHSALVNPERGLRIRLRSLRARESRLPGALGQPIKQPWRLLGLVALIISLVHCSGLGFQL